MNVSLFLKEVVYIHSTVLILFWKIFTVIYCVLSLQVLVDGL